MTRKILTFVGPSASSRDRDRVQRQSATAGGGTAGARRSGSSSSSPKSQSQRSGSHESHNKKGPFSRHKRPGQLHPNSPGLPNSVGKDIEDFFIGRSLLESGNNELQTSKSPTIPVAALVASPVPTSSMPTQAAVVVPPAMVARASRTPSLALRQTSSSSLRTTTTTSSTTIATGPLSVMTSQPSLPPGRSNQPQPQKAMPPTKSHVSSVLRHPTDQEFSMATVPKQKSVTMALPPLVPYHRIFGNSAPQDQHIEQKPQPPKQLRPEQQTPKQSYHSTQSIPLHYHGQPQQLTGSGPLPFNQTMHLQNQPPINYSALPPGGGTVFSPPSNVYMAMMGLMKSLEFVMIHDYNLYIHHQQQHDASRNEAEYAEISIDDLDDDAVNFENVITSLQELRSALTMKTADVDSTSSNPSSNMEEGQQKPSQEPSTSYDPSAVFQSVQTTAMRCHEYWTRRAAQYRRTMDSRHQQTMQHQQSVKKDDDTEYLETSDQDGIVPCSSFSEEVGNISSEATKVLGSEQNGVRGDDDEDDEEEDDEWEAAYESARDTAWEVWAESLWTISDLSRVSVGPGWRSQTRWRSHWQERFDRRREEELTTAAPVVTASLSSSEREPSRRSSNESSSSTINPIYGLLGWDESWELPAHPSPPPGTLKTSGSPSSGHRTSGTELNSDENSSSMGSIPSIGSNPQSAAGRKNHLNLSVAGSPQRDITGTNSNENTSPPTSPQQEHLSHQPPRPVIAESLIPSILRFAGAVTDMALPPARQPDSRILLRGSHMPSVSGGAPRPDPDAAADAVAEEQDWLIRRHRISEAQRVLVLALCTENGMGEEDDVNDDASVAEGGPRDRMDPSSDASSHWTVPRVHSTVSSMVLSWVETAALGWPNHERLASTEEIGGNISSREGETQEFEFQWSHVAEIGNVDWWYTLQVMRAAADLVTSGWRPPPRGHVSNALVRGLLSVSEKGLLLAPPHMQSEAASASQEARDERLAASSSAAEAMCALACLGTRGHYPSSTVKYSAGALCRLLASADPTLSGISVSSLYPLDTPDNAVEEQALMEEKKSFVSQRESCLADAAELLWALLANHSTVSFAVSTLLYVMDVKLSSGPTAYGFLAGGNQLPQFSKSWGGGGSLQSSSRIESKILSSGGAVRALGAALWGNPPHAMGVQSLRVYWSVVLNVLGRVSSTCHPSPSLNQGYLKEVLQDSSNQFDSSLVTSQSTVDLYTIPSLVVMLEIAVALRRLVDGEMTPVSGGLSQREWDTFTSALESGLSPWIGFGEVINAADRHNADQQENMDRKLELCRKIVAEVDAIVNQVEVFIEFCADSDKGHHPIVDSVCRDRLHTVLLGSVCPRFSLSRANSLACAVIKSWTFGGYLLQRGDEWRKAAFGLLKEVFSVNGNILRFPGGYVHSPHVRLEALEAITREYRKIEDTHSSAEKITILVSSLDTGLAPPPPSFEKKMREFHLEPVIPALAPRLMEALSKDRSALRSQDHAAAENSITDSPPSDDVSSLSWFKPEENKQVLADECSLQKKCVRLLGDIFYSGSCERELRSQIIEVLRSVAADDIFGFEIQSKQKTNTNSVFEISTEDGFFICLEAIRQLEHCLRTVFNDLPHMHGMIPPIIDALCSVIELRCNQSPAATISPKDMADLGMIHMLVITSLVPLSSLAMNKDGHAVLLGRKAATRHVPKTIVKIIDDATSPISPMRDIDRTLSGPFAVVKTAVLHKTQPDESPSRQHQRYRETTFLSFDRIVTVTTKAITSLLPDKRGRLESENDESVAQRFTVLTTSCIYQICFNLWSSMVICGIPAVLADESRDALAFHLDDPKVNDSFESNVRSGFCATYAGIITLTSSPESLGPSCEQLIKYSLSDSPTVERNGCRGLSLLLQSLICLSLQNDEVDDEASPSRILVNEVLNSILNRLRSIPIVGVGSFIDNSQQTVPANDVDLDKSILPLLSLLYDLLSACSQSSSSCYPGNDLLEGVIFSWFELARFSRMMSSQARVLGLLCASYAVGMMASDEARVVLQDSNNGTPNSNENDESSSIIRDLLVSRMIQSRRQDSMPSVSSDHEALSEETEEIESFPVEPESLVANPVASWLIGDSLLTCRLGSSKTRYRGWMEVTVRSSSQRIRRLIRVRPRNYVANPDFPSALLDSKTGINRGGAHTSLKKQGLHQMPGSESADASEVITKALSVLKRFEELDLDLKSSQSVDETFTQEKKNPPAKDIDEKKGPTLERKESSLKDTFQQFRSVFPSRSPRIPTKSTMSVFGWDKAPGNTENAKDKTATSQKESNKASKGKAKAVDQSTLKTGKTTDLPSLENSPVKTVRSWLESTAILSPEMLSNVADEFSSLGFPNAMALPDSLHAESSDMLMLEHGRGLTRSISILDRTPALQTHKVGVLFAGTEFGENSEKRVASASYSSVSAKEERLLQTTNGSPSFVEFMQGLGGLVLCRHLKYYSGGLDTSMYSDDGEVALAWTGTFRPRKDDENGSIVSPKTMVLYHAVPLMPSELTKRKRHIGNDMVNIVFLENSNENNIVLTAEDNGDNDDIIRGHFGFVTIFVTPMDMVNCMRVSVKTKNGLDDVASAALAHMDGTTHVVPRECAPSFVRQLAIRADIACRSVTEDAIGPVSNWEDRLSQIRGTKRFGIFEPK